MYSASHPVPASMNGMGGDIIDGSGTINPAALNTVLPTPTSVSAPETSPRGVKRSRSPEYYGELAMGRQGGVEDDDDDDDQKPRKRGRPPKTKLGGVSESPLSTSPQGPQQALPSQIQTPKLQSQGLPHTSGTPTQASPPKSTPTKTVVKALPTVRDHTTDQLNPERDEYIPREYDEAGEKKVTQTGHLLDGREYRCRTFYVPNRGDKLFMLATECARVLGYRDSYLLFNKNRSLYKIIATQAEKDDLIQQEILPYSYRSRQIAIVTAKSMFRQFGSRVIVNGRRVRDDYWESKARKQGFTEEDLAGEKRPGAAKARENAAAEAERALAGSTLGHHGEIVYSNGPGHLEGHPQSQTLQAGLGAGASLAPLPMIHLAPADDIHLRDYGNVPRPRQEMSGPPYLDRSQPSGSAEILNQASHAADFNKMLGQQRNHRTKYLEDFWKQPREMPAPANPSQQQQQQQQQQQTAQAPPQAVGQVDTASTVGQALHSPQVSSNPMMGAAQQPMMPSQQRGTPQMIASQAFPQQQAQHQQSPLAQSPGRAMAQSIRPDQIHHRSSGLSLGPTGHNQNTAYGFSQQTPMWPPPQPQQSPLGGHGMPQFNPQLQSHSPHAQQSPHHAPPQLHQQSSGSLPSNSLNYPGVAPGGYATAQRGSFNPSQNPQHFMQQTSAAQQANPGWAPSAPGSHGQQPWPGY
ncbi:hypothetical protein L228DRAFT_9065 [Xylona heveae TC161]|uniref:Nuclear localization protein n=1 Tax=Xylona heveae (strain CBS 132557 / TC161) TaxID=1328760 RepID=A0A165JIJ3_XYLHT|nr:hypothetical protein L228DRAFT_9065 [Xylona heveae TC161]KZF26286.1 hypothetical protein L228DRAFT_9065 [Xylona heveae TC161]